MTIARQFSEVVHALLLVVPMNSILAVSDTVMANVDEEDEDMQPEASTSGTSGQCRYLRVVVFQMWLYVCNCSVNRARRMKHMNT